MNKVVLFLLVVFAIGSAKAQEVNIIPAPLKVTNGTLQFRIDSKTKIIADATSRKNAEFLKKMLSPAFDLKIKKNGGAGIILKQDNSLKKELGNEGYQLKVSEKSINICAATQTGIFYGIQSLRQLMPVDITLCAEALVIKGVDITDSPRFPWRAYMLDESRHFQGEAFVKKVLDEMALLKMNVFHWHLTDDAGWRIEIKKYPKLTEVGSYRKDSQVGAKKWKSEELAGMPHQGFYTQKQIKDIVAYAAERHITVVPEIEMPGHSSAAIASYQWLGSDKVLTEVPVKFGKKRDNYDVTDDKVIEFLHDVLSEVIELFPSKVIHIGGDEINYDSWRESEKIQQYMKDHGIVSPPDLQIQFTNGISKFIESKGRRMMGWNEIMGIDIHTERGEKKYDDEVKTELAKDAIVHFWKGDVGLATQAAERGYNIVNSYHRFTYLDYNYNSIPLSKAYSFDPIPEGLAEKYHKQVYGCGCQMWTEWQPENDDVERQTFPRLAAYAEVGWTDKERKDYVTFRRKLDNLLRRWEMKDINYSKNFEKKQ
ncbi:glycoside hydrolase family 20 [Puteibacter caeruleilacunae]|nr:glycoside hydrolase family 20 [Puteibacter caeruleilacunae]